MPTWTTVEQFSDKPINQKSRINSFFRYKCKFNFIKSKNFCKIIFIRVNDNQPGPKKAKMGI